MEHLPDLLRVPLAAVIHHARSANYFQVRDSCEAAQDFAVHAIGTGSVGFVAIETFKGQHCDARRCMFRRAIPHQRSNRQQRDRQWNQRRAGWVALHLLSATDGNSNAPRADRLML
jgi:hypothetical protein